MIRDGSGDPLADERLMEDQSPSGQSTKERSTGKSAETASIVDRPENRYRHLIEHVQDAVVEFEFVDDTPIVREINEAFTDIFGYELDVIRGEPLNEWIVPEWKRGEAADLDTNTVIGEINYRQVTRKTATGLREFLYRGIPYEQSEANAGGFAVYTDLTEISQNERQLTVLNRILRHNLRNNANVVAGNVTRLLAELSEPDPTAIDTAATIERAAHELERLAEEAGHIHHVLQQSADETTAIDPAPLVRSVVDEHRQDSPTATIDVDLARSERVFADSHLRYALDSLVDNAIEHNPNPSPRVRVRIDRLGGASDPDADAAVEDRRHHESADWVVIHVEDDGPMIPLNERDVIRDGSAITPTHHGSGLGLWLTELTVETFGGELQFDTSELGGNDVSIRLRRHDGRRE